MASSSSRDQPTQDLIADWSCMSTPPSPKSPMETTPITFNTTRLLPQEMTPPKRRRPDSTGLWTPPPNRVSASLSESSPLPSHVSASPFLGQSHEVEGGGVTPLPSHVSASPFLGQSHEAEVGVITPLIEAPAAVAACKKPAGKKPFKKPACNKKPAGNKHVGMARPAAKQPKAA